MASAGSIRMGRGHVEIGADLNPLQQALSRAQMKVQALGANLMQTGLKAIGAGLAMATPLAMAVTQFATFEQSLANLKAAANPTAAEFAKLKTEIEKVALETGEMPADVAATFGELIKGGKSAEEVMSGLGEATVKFARVSSLSAADAAVALIDAMNIFGEKNPAQVMNIMSAAADASTISLAEVAMAFARGGSAAGLFNQSMEDVATAIAVLGKAGIKGEEAGSMIKTMLSRIASGSEGAAEGMQMLGLTTASFRDASGALKPIQEIMAILQGATEGVPLQIRDEALSKIGGQRGIQGFGAFLKSGSAGWAEMRKQMEGNLTVEQKFGIMTDTLAGNFKRLLVGVSIVAIAIGEALEPALSAIGAVLGPALAGLAEFIRNNQGLVMVAAAAAAALIAFGAVLIFDGARVWLVGGLIGILGRIVMGTVGVFRLITMAFKIFAIASMAGSVALAVLKAGFGLFAVVGAIASGIMWLWNGAVLIGKGVIWLYNAAVAAGTTVMGLFQAALAMGALFAGTFTIAITAVKFALAIYSIMCGVAAGATTVATGGMNLLAGAIGILTVALLAVPLAYFGLAIYQTLSATNALGKAWTATGAAIGAAFDSTWDRAKDTFGKITETAKSALGGIRDAQKVGDWDLAWQIMLAGAKLAWFDIKAFATDTFIDWKFAAISSFQAIADAIKNIFSAVWAGIKIGFADTMLAILGVGANLPGWTPMGAAGQRLQGLREQAVIDLGAATSGRDRIAERREADLAGLRAEEHARAAGLSDEDVAAARALARRTARAEQMAARARASGTDMTAINDELWALAETAVPGTGGARSRERAELAQALQDLNTEAAFWALPENVEAGRRRPGRDAAGAIGAAVMATEALGSFSGTALSGFGVLNVQERTARAVEQAVQQNDEVIGWLEYIGQEGGGVLAG